jgi:hypothetical protein
MNEGKILVTKTKTGRIREFHIRERLSETYESYSNLSDAVSENPEGFKNEAYQLAEELLSIRGVASVDIDGFQITITIGRAFFWREVEPRVMALIKRYLGPRVAMRQASKKMKMTKNKKR